MEGTPGFEARPGGIGPVELLESVIFEDGLDAAIELASHPHLVPGANPVTIMLMISKILTAHAYELLGQDDPFAVDEPDALLGYLDESADLADDAGDEVDRVYDHLARFEAATRDAHQVAQSAGAVRARSIAEFARWEHPDGPQGVTRRSWVRGVEGFTSMYSADTVAAELGLGIQAGIGLVERSARMVHRTPNLLREVACGAANLDTVADIATELQDASPEVCETVEAQILGRGVHRTSRGRARKSCRTLVGKYQPSAARETQRKTKAQQCGVFQDPHPTPGLSMLTVIGDFGKLTAIKDAVDQLAFAMKQGDESGKTLGEYRVDALFDLAMQGVTLHLDIQVLTPTFGTAGRAAAPKEDSAAGASMRPSAAAPVEPPTSPLVEPPDEGGRVETAPADTEQPDIEPEAPTASGRRSDGRAFVASMSENGTASVHARAGVIDADNLADLARFAGKVTVDSFEFDPDTGEPTANTMASDSYRPPPSMARYVRTRDQRCRAPGCDRPAIKNTDLDHVVEWPKGPTAGFNLECLCRRHHRMKQTQWRIRLHPNGIVEWTSPTGNTYTTTPGLTDTWHDLGSQ